MGYQTQLTKFITKGGTSHDQLSKKERIYFSGKRFLFALYIHKHSWRITAIIKAAIVLTLTFVSPNYDFFKKILVHFKGNYVRIVYEDLTVLISTTG